MKLTDNEIRDILRVKKEETGRVEEVWTGDYMFENEWQSLRTKRPLTGTYQCLSGMRAWQP